MATASETRADDREQSGRDSFIAFVRDNESQKIVDQVVADLMIPQSSIRRGGIQEAITYLGENRSPKLLLVDLTDSDLPISAVDTLADVCEPGVTVIAIGERNDVGLFRDLLKQGVADYLVKPINANLLQRSLLNSVEDSTRPRHTSKLGKLITVVGSRGGVGATTVGVNLAWLIAHERRRRVALVDLDLQLGSVALSLDLEPTQGLRQALENPERIDGLFLDRAMIEHSKRLFVLCAEEALEETPFIDVNALDLLISELRSKFHYVVIDVPRASGPCLHYGMSYASTLLIVTDLSLAGMRDTLRLSSIVPTVNAACNVQIIANREGEHKAGEMKVADFERGVGRRISASLPFDGRHCVSAANIGEPLTKGKSPIVPRLREMLTSIAGSPADDLTETSWLKRLWRG